MGFVHDVESARAGLLGDGTHAIRRLARTDVLGRVHLDIGQTLHPRKRRDRHALHAQVCELIQLSGAGVGSVSAVPTGLPGVDEVDAADDVWREGGVGDRRFDRGRRDLLRMLDAIAIRLGTPVPLVGASATRDRDQRHRGERGHRPHPVDGGAHGDSAAYSAIGTVASKSGTTVHPSLMSTWCST